jgi:UDP-N-acetylmuramoyl-tripeptide--D-alanyl-D-alanine ligase
VTGSAGKTSTKDLTAAALRPGFTVHASESSFNNEIGLPVTLLSAPPGSEAVVLEMGARFAGNIRELCAIALPAIGVITNVGLAHVEHLGGPRGIAEVKGELLGALRLTASRCSMPTATVPRTSGPAARAGRDRRLQRRGRRPHLRGRLDDELRATFRLDSP